MPTTSFTHPLQAYLRHIAEQSYQSSQIGDFTVHFHPTDNFPGFSYAIPMHPHADPSALPALRQAFAGRQRPLRFEFIAEFAPDLSAALLAAGLQEEDRQVLMTCPCDGRQSPPPPNHTTLIALNARSAAADLHAAATILRQGFTPTDLTPTGDQDVENLRHTLVATHMLLAVYQHQPAAVASYTMPYDGLSELRGITTLSQFRRKGLASWLTAQVAAQACQHGATQLCLVAEDENAGRLYTRLGFAPTATMLAYRDAAT